MSYQVIARKWRSQSFSELVGQNHISQTLTNALKNNRLHHALLFTGPRGTGKTSSARILAKSLRCPKAVDFKPCNECESCTDINLGRSVDVIEIDGASNNGVDAIRELREGVAFMPSTGKYKVYIIDEVHMLSTSAFNALLKTLEEPPAHVIFVMATTEVHKIPQTILSRCQRFDFRSIPTKLIAAHLKHICQAENVKADDEALWMIARQGDGSMRDSQSLLDQVITFVSGDLTREKVIEILGLIDRTLLLEVLTGLVTRDSDKVFTHLKKLHVAGYEASLFAKDLLENIRHLLLVKISPADHSIIELPDSEIRLLKDLSETASEEDIHMLFDMALKGASDIQRAGEPMIVLEMLLLRMVNAPSVQSLVSLLGGGATNTAASATNPARAASPSTPKNSATSTTTATPKKIDPLSVSPQERWLEFVQKLKQSEVLLAAKVEGLLFISDSNKVIQLAVPAKMGFLKDQILDSAVQKKLQSFVESHFGSGYTLSLQASKDEVKGTSAQTMVQQKEKIKEDEIAKKVGEHPKVKMATSALKAQIKSISARKD